MALVDVQNFLTHYLRDPEFREAYRAGQAEAIEEKFGIDGEGRALLHEINLDELDAISVGFRDDRVGKRTSEFEEFLLHLGVYVPPDDFLADFDRAYPGGTETQPVEMDRFLEFAVEFVLRHGLPEYLVSLAYFCYSFCKIAVAPVVEPRNLPAGRPIRPFDSVELRRPYNVCWFRYDVVVIAQSEPSQSLAMIDPQGTELLITKDSRLFKRSQVHHTRDWRLLPPLDSGRKTVMELMSGHPVSDFPALASELEEMASRGMIDVFPPKHFDTAKPN